MIHGSRTMEARTVSTGSFTGGVGLWTWLDWSQHFFDGLLKLSEVGVFEFLAELIVGLLSGTGDRHPRIVTISGGYVYRPPVVSNSAKAFGGFRILCR